MEWQPIETAPKDGTFYLAYGKDSAWVENAPEGCYPGVWHWSKSRKCWRGSANFHEHESTHWMPLPAPPKATE